MNHLLKPNDLVALMHVVTGSQDNYTGGLLGFGGLEDQTAQILDALATLCVSEPEGQVVAIGIQLQIQEEKICLTIAENRHVKKDLPAYLNEVWSMLAALSLLFKANRVAPGRPGEQKDYRRVFPIMPEGVGSDSKISLFRHIHLYTRAKIQHQVDKWWPDLAKFMKCFYASRKTELVGSERDLDLAFRMLEGAFHNITPKKCARQGYNYWETLYSLFEVATYHVYKLTEEPENRLFCIFLVSQVGKFSYIKVDIGKLIYMLISF